MILESLYVIKWWVYASFNMHNDCQIHTGGIMSLGAGATTSGSWKQKINGRSSNDNNLIRVNDMMVPVLWTLYFIQGQGKTVKINIMFQDNHITMRLMMNGKKSSLRNTKHINVRYFFVKVVINRGEIPAEYFPTEEMWADVLTKPLQGNLYQIMRSKLMNMPELYLEPDENTPAKGSKAAGVYTMERQVEFNQYVCVKNIPKTTGVQTKSVKSARHAKKPTTQECVGQTAIGERNRQT